MTFVAVLVRSVRGARGLVAMAGFASLVACGHLPESATPVAALRLRGTPAQATVTVDDQLVGTLDLVSARGVALPAGKHRISVEANGYFPWDREVESQGAPLAFDVALVPMPD